MEISDEKYAQLVMAKEECDFHDKSTEFMIEYLQAVAKVDHDTVMEFLMELSEEQKKERNSFWQCQNCGWLITNKEYELARLNFLCNNCEETTISDFERRQI